MWSFDEPTLASCEAVVDKSAVTIDRCSSRNAVTCWVVCNIVSHVGLKMQAHNDADGNSLERRSKQNIKQLQSISRR